MTRIFGSDHGCRSGEGRHCDRPSAERGSRRDRLRRWGGGILALVILALLLPADISPGVAGGRRHILRFGTEGTFPPFSYFDGTGALRGLEIDLARAICRRLAMECRFVPYERADLIKGLYAMKYDAVISSIPITAENRKRVDFTAAYYAAPLSFVVRRDSGMTSASASELAGRTVGYRRSTAIGKFLARRTPGSNLRAYPTLEEALLELATGRIDAVVANKLAAAYWIASSGDGGCCRLVGRDIVDPDLGGNGFGIAVRKGDEATRRALDAALAGIIADSTLSRINSTYFRFSGR